MFWIGLIVAVIAGSLVIAILAAYLLDLEDDEFVGCWIIAAMAASVFVIFTVDFPHEKETAGPAPEVEVSAPAPEASVEESPPVESFRTPNFDFGHREVEIGQFGGEK
jgi:ABC-type uncharacterized transport system permease subunit